MAQGRVAFQYPNFRYYMTARFLVAASSEIQAVAVAWQVYGLTGRPVDLGLVGLAQLVVGGLLYGLAGNPVAVYACAAAAYLTGLVLISAMRVKPRQLPRGTARLGVVLEGLRYIWREKLLLGAISLDLFAVLLGGAVALLPVYARDILKIGAAGMGILRSGPGIGAVIMAIAVAHWPLKRHAGAAMLWCVAGFGFFTLVFGLSRNMALSMAALILVGACDMVSV